MTLRTAVTEAQALGHAYVGPEHVLLALTAEPSGAARPFFERHGMTRDAVRQSLAELIGPTVVALLPDAQVTTTGRCERALNIAAHMQTAGAPLEPHHLLAAVLHPDIADDAVVEALLERFGLRVADARAEIMKAPG